MNGVISDGTATTFIQKDGTGTWTLAGSNTYTGTTTINAGTLRANATSAVGSGAVSVNGGGSAYTGGRLGGSGSVTGAITLAASSTVARGGIIAAGPDDSTTGKLTTAAETWNAGSVYAWKIAALGSSTALPTTGGSGTAGTTGTWDDLSMSLLTLSSLGGSKPSFTIKISDTSTLTPAHGLYSWTIAQSTGQVTPPTGYAPLVNLLTPISGNAAFVLDTSGLNISNSIISTDPSAFSLELVPDHAGDDLVLDYTAAPEPTTLTLGLAGAIPLLLSRRRKNTSVPA